MICRPSGAITNFRLYLGKPRQLRSAAHREQHGREYEPSVFRKFLSHGEALRCGVSLHHPTDIESIEIGSFVRAFSMLAEKSLRGVTAIDIRMSSASFLPSRAHSPITVVRFFRKGL